MRRQSNPNSSGNSARDFSFRPRGFCFVPAWLHGKNFRVEPPIPAMIPAPGERLLRFVGDKIIFQLRLENSAAQKNLRAFLRTNLGRAAALRCEIISAH